MNRIRPSYDRASVGKRIQQRRQSLGLSQEMLAEQMDRATKYCSDIERGCCGMSVETMLLYSRHLNMSLDYMMLGINEAQDYLDSIPEDQLLKQTLERDNAYIAYINEFFSKKRKAKRKKK
ncbi:MAG: helix-turn-helix transcriptional regulator [Lachnospiraceae bacterium]|nr:helix-turn-helix transcriptional regulator [Lachnospiraceae bacterium]